MPRALTILKYLPAVLCGLLVVAWVVSLPLVFSVMFPLRWGGTVGVGCSYGRLVIWHTADTRDASSMVRQHEPDDYDLQPWWQTFASPSGKRAELVSLPTLFLLTLLLPLAIGPFIRFRFPLWSWFAFTALVALELAFYLRAG